MAQERDMREECFARVAELGGRFSVVQARLFSWLESIDSIGTVDASKAKDMVKTGTDMGQIMGDLFWVDALMREGVPLDTILAVWERKDNFSRKTRDETGW